MGVKDKHAHEKLHKPAKDGTVNVLQAALAKGIKKVVLTSSVASIQGGHSAEEFEGVEPETIWTDIDAKGVDPYFVSKTIAERAAWEFYEQHKGEGFDLVTINPSLVMGPPVSTGSATSHELVSRLLRGTIPLVPGKAVYALVCDQLCSVTSGYRFETEHCRRSGRCQGARSCFRNARSTWTQIGMHRTL